MSAENELAVFLMENGEWWIVNRACGATMAEFYGECHDVVKKCPTFEEARKSLGPLMDSDSPDYYYTEHGAADYGPFGRAPTSTQEQETKARHMAEPACFLQSIVYLGFANRRCSCLDGWDVYKDDWQVYESSGWGEDRKRLVGEGLSFAQAYTLANLHAIRQPGECKLQLPTHFKRFPDYPAHECDEESRLYLPVRES